MVLWRTAVQMTGKFSLFKIVLHLTEEFILIVGQHWPEDNRRVNAFVSMYKGEKNAQYTMHVHRILIAYLSLCEERWPPSFHLWYLRLFFHDFFPPHGKCGCHGIVNQCPIRASFCNLTLYDVPLHFLTWYGHLLRQHWKKVGFRSPWFFQFALPPS